MHNLVIERTATLVNQLANPQGELHAGIGLFFTEPTASHARKEALLQNT